MQALQTEARKFAEEESVHVEPSLFGVTDGKAVGTYLEQKFRVWLGDKYEFKFGNSAKGIDFPDLEVDLKVTSIRQPQSSCPFDSARQKVFGLGYSLLVFVYQKTDDGAANAATLDIQHAIFVEKELTGDFQTTRGILEILHREGNAEDIAAFLADRNLPLDEIGRETLVREILHTTPRQGYLTISNALQWRLQYARVIEQAGTVEGLIRVR
ncbi:MAG: type II restriction-modification system restriction endonuclease [Candidatus Binataceae bacterium]